MAEIFDICAAVLCTLIISITEYKRKDPGINFLKRFFLLIVAESCCTAGCIINNYSAANGVFMIFYISALYVMSVQDIETKMVSSIILNVTIMTGAVCTLVNIADGGAGRIIIFCLIFIILFTAAKKEKLGIGTGDAKAIAAAALFVSPGTLFVTLFMSLLFSMIYGIFIIVKNKSGVKTELPFIPFLLAGTLAGIIS